MSLLNTEPLISRSSSSMLPEVSSVPRTPSPMFDQEAVDAIDFSGRARSQSPSEPFKSRSTSPLLLDLEVLSLSKSPSRSLDQAAVDASWSTMFSESERPWFPRITPIISDSISSRELAPCFIRISRRRYDNYMKIHGCICGLKYLHSRYRCVDTLSVVLDNWLGKRPHFPSSESPKFNSAAEEHIHEMKQQRGSMRQLLNHLIFERACYQDIINYERCWSDLCEMKEKAEAFNEAIKLYQRSYAHLRLMIALWSKTF
ncbi:hypothetical protein BGX34_005261 [Mortierella sp. NVP85]|nr:hypothetical protein BGX34_005261 [Mortierella sp. NVP85]